MSETRLDRTIEAVLSVGLLASAALLLAGLLLEREGLLRLGVILLMGTPAARVAVVAVGMLIRRDFVFAAVSLWILAVLAGSVAVAVRW